MGGAAYHLPMLASRALPVVTGTLPCSQSLSYEQKIRLHVFLRARESRN